MNSVILKFILYAGVVAGIIIILVMPALSRAVDKQYELIVVQAKLDALKQEKSEIQTLVQNVRVAENKDNVAENEDNNDKKYLPVNRAIASYPDVHDVILSFEEIGSSSGLGHIDVDLATDGTTAGEQDGIFTIDVTVEATGDYVKLVTFLKSLENAGRVFTIHSMSLKSSGSQEDGSGESEGAVQYDGTAQDPVLAISISGVVYYLPAQETESE